MRVPPVHQMPQPLGLFAGEQFERATQYLEAFERLSKTPAPQPTHAMYFLLTHAIEGFSNLICLSMKCQKPT
jgi:hypothetical protein